MRENYGKTDKISYCAGRCKRAYKFYLFKGGIIINENENGAEASEDELLHIMDKKYFVGRIELLLGVSNFRIQI